MIELASEWEKIELDDGVTVEIKPLSLSSYHQLLAFMMPYMSSGELKNEDSQKIMLDSRLPEILNDIIPPHIQKIDGINLDGKAITPELFVQQSQLLMMNILVLGSLMSHSSLSGDEEKN